MALYLSRMKPDGVGCASATYVVSHNNGDTTLETEMEIQAFYDGTCSATLQMLLVRGDTFDAAVERLAVHCERMAKALRGMAMDGSAARICSCGRRTFRSPISPTGRVVCRACWYKEFNEECASGEALPDTRRAGIKKAEEVLEEEKSQPGVCEGCDCGLTGARCGAESPASGRICTELLGHPGPHVTCSNEGHSVASW